MINTSVYSIEERLVANVWVSERPHIGPAMSEIMDMFTERFQKAGPRKKRLCWIGRSEHLNWDQFWINREVDKIIS